MYHARGALAHCMGGKMSKVLATLLAILASLGAGGVALAADAQAGRSVAQSKCSQCHDADDWEGEDAASLESLIRDIVAGKVKHKSKVELGAAEIANIAAYWGQGRK
jgi:mono/diheme cytochrome c family protein